MNALKPPPVIVIPSGSNCTVTEAALRARCERQATRGTRTDLLCTIAAYEVLEILGIVPSGAAHAVRLQCLGMFNQRHTTEA